MVELIGWVIAVVSIRTTAKKRGSSGLPFLLLALFGYFLIGLWGQQLGNDGGPALLLSWAWVAACYGAIFPFTLQGVRLKGVWQCPECQFYNDPSTLICPCGFEHPEAAGMAKGRSMCTSCGRDRNEVRELRKHPEAGYAVCPNCEHLDWADVVGRESKLRAAKDKIEEGWFAGSILVAISLAPLVLAFLYGTALKSTLIVLGSILIFAALTFGLYRESRMAAIGLLAFFGLEKTALLVTGQLNPITLLTALAFLSFILRGVQGTFQLHHLRAELPLPESPLVAPATPTSSPSTWVGLRPSDRPDV